MKLNFISAVLAFFVLFNANEIFASSISPELEKKLKADGKWEQFVESLQIAKEKGINQPNKNAINFNDINMFDKKTVYLNALVILVDFNDHLADTVNHNPSAFDHLLFSEGVHSTGSMNDFYLENSYDNWLYKRYITGFSYYFLKGSKVLFDLDFLNKNGPKIEKSCIYEIAVEFKF